MKFLVIVICLLSERFLLHKVALHRFHWFSTYATTIAYRINTLLGANTSWLILGCILFPFIVGAWIILHSFEHLLFGVIGFILHVGILLYCLGPINPFYLESQTSEAGFTQDESFSYYLSNMNEQLFAVLFWYMILGPLGALGYRLFSLAKQINPVSDNAKKIFDAINWLPVRMTALLYLLVGNFQSGFRYFSKHVLSIPEQNYSLLSHCSLHALGTKNVRAKLTFVDVENFVMHAVMVLLVFFAFWTMIA